MKIIPLDDKQLPVVINNSVTKPPTVVMAGIRGTAGKDGSNELITASAGENISALKVVYIKEGKAYQLSHTDDDNIFLLAGIAVTGALQNTQFKIKRQGELIDQSFNFALGRVYLGADGALTQTPPDNGYCILMGAAVTTNTLLLNIQDPIEL